MFFAQRQAILHLPHSGDLVVRSIDYADQLISLGDPEGCLPKHPTGDLELQLRPGLQVIALLSRGVGELHTRQLHMESAHGPARNFDHTRQLSRWGGCMVVVASTDDLLARWLFSD
ncbi:hypothetical protein NL676_010032 [Syzygium grande]|nr:hypothetical protein NL676_010032 [Syzygium grande]